MKIPSAYCDEISCPNSFYNHHDSDTAVYAKPLLEFDVTPKWGEFQTMRASNIKDNLYLNCIEAPYFKRELEDCTIEIKD